MPTTWMVGIINREPHVTKDIIRFFYLNAINNAKESIKLINPYFTLNRKLKRALAKAVKRGVKVEIMLSVRSDIPITPDVGFYNVGSANLNARSLRWDREENAVIIDPHVTRQLNQLFEQQKQDSFLLTEEKWDQWRTPWKKFVGWAGHLLAPFL